MNKSLIITLSIVVLLFCGYFGYEIFINKSDNQKLNPPLNEITGVNSSEILSWSNLSGSISSITGSVSTGASNLSGFSQSSISSESSSDDLSKIPTDYSQDKHWLSLPNNGDKSVDVFYLYPTAWQRINDEGPYICDVDNPMMMKGAALAYARQATAFESMANIYAPYYRQGDAKYTLTLQPDQQVQFIQGPQKTDVFAAFDYYIKNFNKGRPFILVGHSQGSNLLIYLLSEYMKENPDVNNRMIAAYVIGYSVTQDYMDQNSHLKFAESANDTGVIISYNTQSSFVQGKNPVVLSGALVINPISWTRDEKLATAKQNLGSILMNKDGTVKKDDKGNFHVEKNYADAKIDKAKGVLICSTLDDSTLQLGFGPGIYHSYDYPLYYYNIQQNAQNRIKKYFHIK